VARLTARGRVREADAWRKDRPHPTTMQMQARSGSACGVRRFGPPAWCGSETLPWGACAAPLTAGGVNALNSRRAAADSGSVRVFLPNSVSRKAAKTAKKTGSHCCSPLRPWRLGERECLVADKNCLAQRRGGAGTEKKAVPQSETPSGTAPLREKPSFWDRRRCGSRQGRIEKAVLREPDRLQ